MKKNPDFKTSLMNSARRVNNPVFNPNIPLVHSISGNALEGVGFVKFSTHVKPNTQAIITTYKRGDATVTFDGVSWEYNGSVVRFMEDIKL